MARPLRSISFRTSEGLMFNCGSKDDKFLIVNSPSLAAQKKVVVRQLKMAKCSGLFMSSFPRIAVMKSMVYGRRRFRLEVSGASLCAALKIASNSVSFGIQVRP